MNKTEKIINKALEIMDEMAKSTDVNFVKGTVVISENAYLEVLCSRGYGMGLTSEEGFKDELMFGHMDDYDKAQYKKNLEDVQYAVHPQEFEVCVYVDDELKEAINIGPSDDAADRVGYALACAGIE